MSKKMKLRLENLKVTSFVTNIENPRQVKAGTKTIDKTRDTCLPYCLPPTLHTWCEPETCQVECPDWSGPHIETCPETCLCTMTCLSEVVPC